MAAQLILAKNIDISKISYDSVRKNAVGGNIVYIKYDNIPKLSIQTCELSAPFGLSTFTDDKSGNVKYSLDISFRGMDDNPEIKEFYDKMCSMDEMLISQGIANSKEWFGKKLSKEVVENFYRPLIKPSKEPEKYAPTMKLKIRQNRLGAIDCPCYYTNKERVDFKEALVPGVQIAAILECNSIWFVNKNMFGISWNIVQLKVQKSNKIAGFSFIEDETEEEEYEEEYEEA
uniref:Uncharacterized protein n=1 Tax=viral metagenome TaxID=1070528 RepID=A0A6C0F5L3_9ZZZZ